MTTEKLPPKYEAMNLIWDEYAKAVEKHPIWPKDKIHAVAIMMEEAGEAQKAVLDNVYAKGKQKELIVELAQTGAMALRCIENLLEGGDERI